MPIGPQGQKRPASTIQNAILVAKIATREAEEEYEDSQLEEPNKGSKAERGGIEPQRCETSKGF